MSANYENFLAALEGVSAPPTLFEPFISRYLCEQLIWRRGEGVWSTPEAVCDTMISLRERTLADVVCLDLRGSTAGALERMLGYAARNLPDGCRLVIMSGDAALLRESERSPLVCATARYGAAAALPKPEKPCVFMDGTLDEAISAGAGGWFARSGAEDAINRAGGRITVCAGLGEDYINTADPAMIHERCAALMANRRYILGSGGEAGEYLGLISMLGIYARHRRF